MADTPESQQKAQTQVSLERNLSQTDSGSSEPESLGCEASKQVIGSLADSLAEVVVALPFVGVKVVARLIQVLQTLNAAQEDAAIEALATQPQSQGTRESTGLEASQSCNSRDGTSGITVLAGCLAKCVIALSPDQQSEARSLLIQLLNSPSVFLLPPRALVPLLFAALASVQSHKHLTEMSPAGFNSAGKEARGDLSDTEMAEENQEHKHIDVGSSGAKSSSGEVTEVERLTKEYTEVRQCVERAAAKLFKQGSLWAVYRVARRSATCGMLALAGELFERLSAMVENEDEFFWLRGLATTCKAEAHLFSTALSLSSVSSKNSVGTRGLHAARLLRNASDCLTSVVASAPKEHPRTFFQRRYTTFRADFIDLLVPVISACLQNEPVLRDTMQRLQLIRNQLAGFREGLKESDDSLDAASQAVLCNCELECVIVLSCIQALVNPACMRATIADLEIALHESRSFEDDVQSGEANITESICRERRQEESMLMTVAAATLAGPPEGASAPALLSW
eukprot:CAMPEP_0196593548 /NCGR_PEP_ID=MMETSP1081-20130531/75947_1 /TAXON_ID=36882 /ORGANISM="Pyramimonas amylifera, Strain CCMP720" /LENGTH=511 /DNA_ID=CAMNT_0041917561 /DNA_START=547 /DNA_END=2079 /DNA_ORIENTATION=-